VDDGAEGRPGATLVLRVDPARALDVQYRAAQIMNRINAYFGYRAVDEVRIVQGVVEQQDPASKPKQQSVMEPCDGLEAALARLKTSIAGK
jgi:hypothetical protein